ncbi:hypothetical protein L484_027637 [Morus notabilis]|uniref:Anther-specific protein BCP1 n=1 Tax=Morus notabilis TaxID=981085 RepID=W9RCC8_9ROSA|nr:anther-specific protein BCP1 [Morus notabilis]EXB82462.1 hypothetical protein L484_027637 [Morus notabilis]
MARPNIVVVLALLLFAVAGLASAETPDADAAVPSFGPSSDDLIGNSDEGISSHEDEVVEAPVGGPAPPGAFPPTAEAPGSHSGASAIDVSAVAGVAVAAVAGYFF